MPRLFNDENEGNFNHAYAGGPWFVVPRAWRFPVEIPPQREQVKVDSEEKEKKRKLFERERPRLWDRRGGSAHGGALRVS